ncbi:hypothetical protein F5880DRAFT_1698908 [Lentinula raphanica]|nr:hypothetical protein F5880DRAFT_1698908 [Lentinula raphanica]
MASLPPELLYEIFKLAGHEAQKSGKGLLNLTLVSHDTNNLIRSIALRFFILSISPRYAMHLKALHTVPPLCLQKNVQGLWIIYALPDSDAQFALECCTNIKSLAYWSREPVASRLHIRSLIQALPHLTRLSAGVDFFIALCKESHLNRFSLSLRELAIFLIPADDDKVEIPDFSSFPNLTHFVIGTTTSVTLASSMINAILKTTRCEVIILEGFFSPQAEISDASFITDPRFFCQAPMEGFFDRWAALEESKANWEGAASPALYPWGSFGTAWDVA